MRYATDYYMKCVRDNETFYYQVGNGNLDHKDWITASMKAVLPRSLGGEAERSRIIGVDNGGTTSMTALCGASLAAMARLYKQFDPEYADKCMEKALVAYDYVLNTDQENCGAVEGAFYGAKQSFEPDVVIFCMEMYRATGDEKYKQEANNYTDFMTNPKKWNHGWTLGYDHTEDIAYYLLAMYADDATAKERLEYYVNTMYKKDARDYILWGKHKWTWGMLRYTANQAFLFALYDKFTGKDNQMNEYALRSIEYILGSNSRKQSFVVGMGEKYPQYPHYRNFFLDDSNNMAQCKPNPKFLQLGYLVGGNADDSEYKDDINNYQMGEGGIDYNAGLVGALGYLNSLINPVDTSKFSASPLYSAPTPCLLYPNPAADYIYVNAAAAETANIYIYAPNGLLTFREENHNMAQPVNISNLFKGIYTVKAVADGKTYVNRLIKQ